MSKVDLERADLKAHEALADKFKTVAQQRAFVFY